MAGTCPSCGVRIADNIVKCEQCGVYVLSDADVCHACGTAIQQEKDSLPQKGEATAETELASTASLAEKIAQQEKPKGKGWKVFFILFFILLLMGGGAGAAYYYYQIWQAEQENEAYEQVMHVTNPEFCISFLNRYPNSPHRAQVEQHMAMLEAEEAEWQAILLSPTRVAVQQFMQKHPDSAHSADCNELVDSIDWRDACTINTEESINNYIATHSNGKYQELALERLVQVRLCKVTPQNVTMLRGVLEAFLTNAYALHDEADVRAALASDTISFCQKEKATIKDVMAHALGRAEKDVIGKHFMVGGEPVVEKNMAEDGTMSYRIACDITVTDNRSDATKNISNTIKMEATLTADYKFMSIRVN